MVRHPNLLKALSLAAMIALPAIGHAVEYRLGIFAGSASRENQAELKATFEPLASYIAKASGANVRIEISQSFRNMDRRVKSGRYAILLSATQFTADSIEKGYEPVAKWDKPLYGVFVAPVDKPYKRIADLKGQRVGIVGREIVTGPLCLNALNKGGLRADKDLAYVYEGEFQDVMSRQLMENMLDAACLGPGPWKALNEQAPGKFKVLAETIKVPGFAFSIDGDLSPQEKGKLKAILVGIGKTPEGKRALAAIRGSAVGATDTEPTSAKEYADARQVLVDNKKLYDAQIPKQK